MTVDVKNFTIVVLGTDGKRYQITRPMLSKGHDDLMLGIISRHLPDDPEAKVPFAEYSRTVIDKLTGVTETMIPVMDGKPLDQKDNVDTMTQKEISRTKGYTGDCCDSCHQFTMKRVGTCLTCDSCGSTTGCG